LQRLLLTDHGDLEPMDTLPLHPKLVHLPLALAVLMPLLSSGLLLAWWRGWFRPRTWILAVAAQGLLLVSGILSMRSGEADEDRVERFVPEAAIESHEEAAEAFVWAGGLVLGLALLPLLLRQRRLGLAAGIATIAGSVAVLVLGVRVGEAGGELVYRYGAASAFVGAAPATAAPAGRDLDDDR
jgi:uncharacterized membrane protein